MCGSFSFRACSLINQIWCKFDTAAAFVFISVSEFGSVRSGLDFPSCSSGSSQTREAFLSEGMSHRLYRESVILERERERERCAHSLSLALRFLAATATAAERVRFQPLSPMQHKISRFSVSASVCAAVLHVYSTYIRRINCARPGCKSRFLSLGARSFVSFPGRRKSDSQQKCNER